MEARRKSLCWWHLCLHTLGSWLHGDPRGFRSRGHRIHSSGDYKSPPPDGEHAGLFQFQQARSRQVILPEPLLGPICDALRVKCEKSEIQVIAISVSPTHAHLLLKHDDDYEEVMRLSGRLKQAASHAVRMDLPGKLWAAGGRPIAIESDGHFQSVIRYIADHRIKEQAACWQAEVNAEFEKG